MAAGHRDKQKELCARDVSFCLCNVILPVVCMVVFNNFFVFNYVESGVLMSVLFLNSVAFGTFSRARLQNSRDFPISCGNSVVGTLLNDILQEIYKDFG